MHDAIDSEVEAAARFALGKPSRASVRRLSDDLSVIICGIRPALLWDASPPDDGRPEAFLCELRRLTPSAAALRLLCIGDAAFVVHAERFAALLHEPLPGSPGGPILHAVDPGLPAPSPCDAATARRISEQLGQLASDMMARLQQVPIGTSTARLPAPEPASTMVAINGWLLGYPTIFCYADATPCESGDGAAPCGSCLGGLDVFRLVASRAADARASTAQGRPPQSTPRGRAARAEAARRPPHLVCSFSAPASDAPPEEGDGEEGGDEEEHDDAPPRHSHEDPRARPSIRRWLARMERRFAQQQTWRLESLSVERRAAGGLGQHVVL